MAARRSLAEILGEPTEEAPPAKWGWRQCECGAVFLAPEGRAKCVVCRTGFQVVRVGRGVSEDDPEEGDGEMAQALGIDETRVQQMIADGMPPAHACRELKVTAIQFAHWCYRKHVAYPGVPTPNTVGVAKLQAEVDALAAPQLPASVAAAIRAEIEASPAPAAEPMPENIPAAEEAPAVEAPAPDQATSVAPIPEAAPLNLVPQPDPFRALVREGGVVLPIRVEGRRIIVSRDLLVEGDITDVEAEMALKFLRGLWHEQEPAGVEVVVEAS